MDAQTLNIRRINHVQITVPKGQEAEALTFYCDVLGLREIAKPESLAGRGGLWLEIGDQQIHIGTEAGFDRMTTKAHIAYEVADVAYWQARLEEHGAVIADSVPIPGFDRFETRDPFGNRIEFIQPVEDSLMSKWTPFEDGRTIGIKGSEGGTVTNDEQIEGGARITLERDCLRAPYAITCIVYGWAYHTRFIADEPTARQAYNEMKDGLAEIIALMPEVDLDATLDAAPVDEAIAEFVERFP